MTRNKFFMTLLLLLFLSIYINGYMSYINVKGGIQRQIKSICYMNSGGVNNIVPSSYYEVEKLLTKSIIEVFSNFNNNNDNSNSNSNTLYSIDMLTPGLNPKLEQKAIIQLELLFSLLTVVCPILSSIYSDIRLQFPSTGDAAGFQKYCLQTNKKIPDNCILEMVADKYDNRNLDCDLESINCSNDCVVFISIKNSVGDPLIDSIRKYCEQRNGLTAIFLNCDLSDKTTVGLQLKGQRDLFRNSIKSLFYFRNIVSISRPTLNPIEKGAIIYTPSTKWQLFAVNDDDIYGPGSLNRYCKVNTFMKDKRDKTSFDPPRFVLAGVFNDMPKRDEVDGCLEKAYYSMSNGISLVQEKVSNPFIEKLRMTPVIESDNSMDLLKLLVSSPITIETETEGQKILQICKNLQNLYSKTTSNSNLNYFDNSLQKQGAVGYFDDNDQQLKQPRQTDKKSYSLLLSIDTNSGAISQSSSTTQLTLSFLNDNKLVCVTDKYTFNGKYITNSNGNNGADMIGIFEPASAFAGFIKVPVPNLLKEFNPYWILNNENGMGLSINTMDKKSFFCIWKIIN